MLFIVFWHEALKLQSLRTVWFFCFHLSEPWFVCFLNLFISNLDTKRLLFFFNSTSFTWGWFFTLVFWIYAAFSMHSFRISFYFISSEFLNLIFKLFFCFLGLVFFPENHCCVYFGSTLLVYSVTIFPFSSFFYLFIKFSLLFYLLFLSRHYRFYLLLFLVCF